MIILEWLNGLISAGDDLFKVIVGLLTAAFGGSKIWDFWQKKIEGGNKLEEARINADKEIQNNKDKHRVELEKLQNTIDFQKTEIAYKDNIIADQKRQVFDYQDKYKEAMAVNDEKDREYNRLMERLLDCEKSKNK
jgi:uncharacterized protein HemX